MPNILIRVPQGCLDTQAKSHLAAQLTAISAEIEQIPDKPHYRSLCWVLIEEISPGCWTCGGIDITAQVVPIMLQIYAPAGVIDNSARERFAAAVMHTFKTICADDKRRLVISSLFVDVPNGTWGVDDRIWHTSDFARAAGYRHLQHLVAN
jgi:phenylpyruvate tautomerase PptA (4-oxalocrotonate tautomerase family)